MFFHLANEKLRYIKRGLKKLERDLLLFFKRTFAEKVYHPIDIKQQAGFTEKKKLRILLAYNRVEHHMAEFINIAFRKRFTDIEIFSCGPNNEFHIPDNRDSHIKIAQLANRLGVDVFIELESGHVSLDYQFNRIYPPINAVKLWWVNDSHQFLEYMVPKAKYFDHVFVSMKDDAGAFGPKSSWLPGSACIDVAVDYNLPRDYDISFVGSMDQCHRDRKQFIESLQRDFNKTKFIDGLFLEDMARIYSSSKIVFNKSLKGDVNYRVFEALACGALLITDNIKNGLTDLYQPEKDIILYDSYAELKEKISYYLNNEKERLQIAKSGQKKTLLMHTVDHRVMDIIRYITTYKQDAHG